MHNSREKKWFAEVLKHLWNSSEKNIDPNVQKKWAFMSGLLVIARVIAIAKPERIPTGVCENGTERSIA